MENEPLTTRLPIIFRVEPSNVKLDSTVALGAEPFNVITPLSVVPVNDKRPLEPDDPL